MFENVGGKLKTLAIVFFVISVVGLLITGIVVGSNAWDNGFLWFLLIFVVGSFVSYLSALGMYALGEAAESATEAAAYGYKLQQKMESEKCAFCGSALKEQNFYAPEYKQTHENKTVEVPDYQYCKQCGKKFNAAKNTVCPECGAELNAIVVPEFETGKCETGKCELCGKENVEVISAKITDDLGVRYRKVCKQCFTANNCQKA